MELEFIKMNGIGNDYIFLDYINKEKEFEKLKKYINLSDLSIKLSNRNYAIGSDGLVIIKRGEIAQFSMIMLNADGSYAKMCGNAIRCIGKYVYEKGYINKYIKTTTIEIANDIKKLKLEIDKNSNLVKDIIVNMNKASFDILSIPFDLDYLNQNYNEFGLNKDKILKNGQCINENINIIDTVINFTTVSIPNPHCIVILDDINKLNDDYVLKYGKFLESFKLFKEKINVIFVYIIDKSIVKLKVYERGSKITKACGSGASGLIAVLCKLNLLNFNNYIKCILDGGNLSVMCDSNYNVFLKGSADISFYGTVKI